jgi:hypothetical protein
MYIDTSIIIILSLFFIYLLWANYKYSPKRIIKSLWDQVQKNAKKIYTANEANETEIVASLNKENSKKTFIINNLLNYYFDKNSKYYHWNYDTDLDHEDFKNN